LRDIEILPAVASGRNRFGLRKFDLVRTSKGTGFVKGKRSSGHFAIMDVTGKDITASVDIRQNVVRLSARSTTLIGRTRLIPALKDGGSAAMVVG
jgi:hypothetical protein